MLYTKTWRTLQVHDVIVESQADSLGDRLFVVTHIEPTTTEYKMHKVWFETLPGDLNSSSTEIWIPTKRLDDIVYCLIPFERRIYEVVEHITLGVESKYTYGGGRIWPDLNPTGESDELAMASKTDESISPTVCDGVEARMDSSIGGSVSST